MALMGYNYNADRIKPSTYIQTSSYNNVDVENIDFGALLGGTKKKNRSRITSVAVFCGGSRSHIQPCILSVYFCALPLISL